jgi:hypothetical protein
VSIDGGGREGTVAQPDLNLAQIDPGFEQMRGIGSKGGVLPRQRGTFPPSALQTGQTAPRCIRLSRIALSKIAGACCDGDEPYGNHDTTVSFDGYASGPSPCTWLSHAPWVDVTPPTTTASLPHLVPILPKPAASKEESQSGSPVVIWRLGWGRVGFQTCSP